MLLEFLTADILNFRIHPIKWLISCILITEVIPIFTLLFITNLLIEVYIGLGLKDGGFRDVALTSIRLWQSLGHSEESSKELVSQLRRFEARLAPFDLPYTIGVDTPSIWWGSIRTRPRHLAELADRIFSINPSQASCKRNFSTLK